MYPGLERDPGKGSKRKIADLGAGLQPKGEIM